jgi:hypothetical protein
MMEVTVRWREEGSLRVSASAEATATGATVKRDTKGSLKGNVTGELRDSLICGGEKGSHVVGKFHASPSPPSEIVSGREGPEYCIIWTDSLLAFVVEQLSSVSLNQKNFGSVWTFPMCIDFQPANRKY